MPKSIVRRGVDALVGVLLPACVVAEQDRASLKHVRRWYRSFLLCLTIATGCTAGGAVEESVGEALGEGMGCVLEDSVLVAPDPFGSDEFGYSVSVDGNVAIIGAHLSDEVGLDSGSAYVFRDNGTSWVFEQKLVPSDAATYDLFGTSVAISGNVALVGAPGDNPAGEDSGSAYVYRYENCDGDAALEWCFEQKLLALDPAAADFLGIGVALSGTTAVVGAYGDDDGGNLAGAAYVFKYNGSTWTQQTKLKASDAAANDFFGTKVAVSGPVVVAGAVLDDDHGPSSGAAYVFRWSGSTWTQEAKLLASDGAAEDGLGDAVSVSGDVVVLGASGDDDSVQGSGSAYVFHYGNCDADSALEWCFEQKLLALDGAYNAHFGKSAAVSGNIILIGAPFDSVGLISSAGAAYVFGFDGSTWVEQNKLMAPDGFSYGGHFGNAVSASGDAFLVGHYGDDGGGSAAVFEGPCTSGECASHSDCDDSNPCVDDLCVNGACVNMMMAYGTFCPPDSNPCTSDICIGGVCSHPNQANGVWCNDNLYCNGSDTCSSGVCMHTGSPCAANQSCNESTNQCVAGGPVCGDGACDASGETCASCAADCRPDADLNLNCCVNSEDLGLLLGAWGPSSGNADLDGNGIVNASDIALLLAAWGCS